MNDLQPKPNVLPRHQQIWVQELLTHIHQANKHTNLSVQQLARRFKMSERQFYRRVKQNLEFTPNQLVRNIKMQKAKELLKAGVHATVAELAYDLGYNHPEYFSNVFQTTFGKRPSHYLKNPSSDWHFSSVPNGR